ncbi:hypothetical protein AKO1_002084 [Acrasis kona]|uniref:Uncharacterized protein n=1 Tax=Acrasis kona TaxID=1008807 RepID=A0AAW2YP55_9EUKA
MIINMWDRMPTIWDNDGNIGNLYVHNKKPYAIDNIAGAILVEDKSNEHQLKIEQIIATSVKNDANGIIQGDDFCESIRKFFDNNLSSYGYEISDDCLGYVRKGFLEAIEEWSEDESHFEQVLDVVWKDINEMLNKGTWDEEDSLDNYSTKKEFFLNNYYAMRRSFNNAKIKASN